MLKKSDIDSLLLNKIPEFSKEYYDHLDDYGEILPHVLFGGLTRFLIRSYRQSKIVPEQWDLFLRILSFVEHLYIHGDDYVTELVVVSFLENLHQAGNDYKDIKKYLKDQTGKQLTAMENWRL